MWYVFRQNVETVIVLIDWLIICPQFYPSFGNCCLIKQKDFFRYWKVITHDTKHYNCVVKFEGETWRELIVLWLERTLLIIPVPVSVVTQSLFRKDILNEILKCIISAEMYSWLLDLTALVYADKIRLVHPCQVATSTRLKQSPLAPLAMSILTVYFVCFCLSIIMLNPLNTPCE